LLRFRAGAYSLECRQQFKALFTALLIYLTFKSANLLFLTFYLFTMLRCGAMSQLCLVFLKLVIFFCQLNHFSFQIARFLLENFQKFFLFRCFLRRGSVLHSIHTILLSMLKGLLLCLLQFFSFHYPSSQPRVLCRFHCLFYHPK